jgi:hypothetical protein
MPRGAFTLSRHWSKTGGLMLMHWEDLEAGIGPAAKMQPVAGSLTKEK